MTLTLIDRTRRTDHATDHATEQGAGQGADHATDQGVTPEAAPEAPSAQAPDPAPRQATGREADGLAVASFVLGLIGLLAFNLLLGPTAIVMALLSLARRTRRPGRAYLGLALGVADLVVLAVLVTVNGAVAWNLGA
ncbi:MULTISPECIES: DUF4190 domain-containing protein [Streptomyces]|uniref:DUF4190 domain-containing protein n=1 Tax=Streptomyces TaxID=1883 RepID=UPI0004C5C967|nr:MULTISPECIES: DUF4190 domain-containing protein [Streptomyces]ONI50398.1 hypothetical protein STIB_54930 [Streptomyces sp. IB2014 011-1]RDV47379.1 DUF4190 domain-containing protein [Streptomyces sp. IB2014 011-12]